MNIAVRRNFFSLHLASSSYQILIIGRVRNECRNYSPKYAVCCWKANVSTIRSALSSFPFLPRENSNTMFSVSFVYSNEILLSTLPGAFVTISSATVDASSSLFLINLMKVNSGPAPTSAANRFPKQLRNFSSLFTCFSKQKLVLIKWVEAVREENSTPVV